MTELLNQWGFTNPNPVRVPPENVTAFLNEAPEDTLISVDGEVSRKLSGNRWRDLDTLVFTGGYSGTDTWDEMPSSELNWLAHETTEVLVLHVPTVS